MSGCNIERAFICEHPRNDLVKPAMITDLSATLYENDRLIHLRQQGIIRLNEGLSCIGTNPDKSFTAPGDDDQFGRASRYEVRTAATALGFDQFREDFTKGDNLPRHFYNEGSMFR